MNERPLELPSPTDWRQLGAEVERELKAGKQSRVFAATLEGRAVVLKLTDPRLKDGAHLTEQMLMVEALAERCDMVVAPIRWRGRLTHEVAGWSATATPLAVGRAPDVAVAEDASLLGRTLAELHDALAATPCGTLPPVAALADVDAADGSPGQVVHGDFSEQNVIVTAAGPKVFDFDDCAVGPVLYDVANSLYMVLFDAEVNGNDARYLSFRRPFLDGYAEVASTAVDEGVVDSLIDARVDALARWLDDLSTAPIGIRTSSASWQQTLCRFVASRS